jgi:hypothetical protein
VNDLLELFGDFERIATVSASGEQVGTAANVGLILLRPGHPPVTNVSFAFHDARIAVLPLETIFSLLAGLKTSLRVKSFLII